MAREKLVPYHWYPKESQQQARIDEYLEWQHTNTRLACTTYFQTMWLDPIVKGEQSDKEKVSLFYILYRKITFSFRLFLVILVDTLSIEDSK